MDGLTIFSLDFADGFKKFCISGLDCTGIEIIRRLPTFKEVLLELSIRI